MVRQLWLWTSINTAGEIVIPTFAIHPEYHQRMADIGAAYGAQSWYNRILGQLAFGSPDQVVPLQGADLIAHQINWDVERRRFGPFDLASGGPTKALMLATGDRFVHGHWFDVEGLALTQRRFSESGEIYPLSV
jgi:hypothetical protein